MTHAPLLALTLTCLALGSPAAAAQKADKQAEASFRSSGRQAVATLRTSVAAGVSSMKATIKEFDAAAKDTDDIAGLITMLVDDLDAFRFELRLDIDSFRLSYAGAGLGALGQLEGDGSLNGQYPRAFHAGTGGLADQLMAAAQSIHDRALVAVERKLRASAKRVEKTHNRSLIIRLPPTLIAPLALGPNVAGAAVEPLEIFVTATTSSLDVASDGLVLVTGIDGVGDFTLTLSDHISFNLDSITISDGAGARVALSFDDMDETMLLIEARNEFSGRVVLAQSLR